MFGHDFPRGLFDAFSTFCVSRLDFVTYTLIGRVLQPSPVTSPAALPTTG